MTPPLFFDLDGTLIDPVVGITRSIQYALERLGTDCSQDLTWCIGPPLRESFVSLVGEGQADRAVDLYRERFAEVGWRENTVYPGIPELLSELSAWGVTLYVATSKPHVYATKILQHFGLADYFAAVFGSELDGTRVHKTDLLNYAKKRLSIDGTAIMIGDRCHDIVGARANGLQTIGVSYGYGSVAELQQAEQMATSPEDLLNLLRSRLGTPNGEQIATSITVETTAT